MTEISQRKRQIHEFSQAIHDVTAGDISDALTEYYNADADLYGPAPIDHQSGIDSIASEYWEPLLEAFPDLEKNNYILFGGEFEGDKWVCATGNLVGTFENEWIDIPATGQATWLRYGEFHRFEGDQIAETRVLIDILDVLRQAGYSFFPSLAPEIVIPGPTTHDGILLNDQDDDDSEKTLQLVEEMLFEWLESIDDLSAGGSGARKYWHEDFMWYGPAGTGTTRGIDGFLDGHQGPFQKAFPNFEAGNHVARFAEGNYCASTGWPSLTATHAESGWLGLPATDEQVGMRIIDVWRREGDLLAENWVFIDMIDLLDQLGVDVFARVRDDRQYFR
ncbi:ester cyclase [Halobellus sp. EA9]|uniref:ester cyclase n=1 Tax=Halobellus sp. EA9 TaxID=3421647 RepID=UPI003EB91433